MPAPGPAMIATRDAGEAMAGPREKGAGRRCAIGAAAALAVLLAAAGAMADGLPPGLVSDAPIWTEKPVRIDRRKQAYERIAVERRIMPARIRITPRVAVFDSSSFREGGHLYVLTGAVAVDPRRLCRGAGGRIAACGQQARLYLKRLITNRTLACAEDYRTGALSFVTCSLQDRDIAETLVGKGAAWAATAALRAKQDEAMRRGDGIWTDTECRAAGRCPPERRRRALR